MEGEIIWDKRNTENFLLGTTLTNFVIEIRKWKFYMGLWNILYDNVLLVSIIRKHNFFLFHLKVNIKEKVKLYKII